jgi:toxin ParE1/3/4
MSKTYNLRPKARADLVQIYRYSVVTWGPEQAEFYLNQLDQHINFIAANPTLGRLCPEIKKGYYKYSSGSHFIYYRAMDDGVDIVRILHQRMSSQIYL